MVFAAGVRRSGDDAAGQMKSSGSREVRLGAGEERVFAGAARADDEDELA